MVPLFHVNPGVVDEQAVQPARDPGGDVTESRFVVVDSAHHPHLMRDVLPLDGHRLDLHQGSSLGGGDQRPQACRAGRHGYQVHAAQRAFAWLRAAYLRVHRAGPKRCRGGGRGGGRPGRGVI